MNYRDWLQQVIYKIINPVVRGMIKIGITPNFKKEIRLGDHPQSNHRRGYGHR